MSRTVVITGSNSGIGKLTAEFFAQNGWNVAATMRNLDNAGIFSGSKNIHSFQLDVTDAASIERSKNEIVGRFGKIDVLVNNAGFGVYGAFELASETDIDRQLAVNIKGLMMVTKSWLSHFRHVGGGTIVNVSSVAGINSYPLASLYVASKWAVEGFTESLSYEVRPFNIKMKLVEPGGFKTNFQTTSITWTDDPAISAYDEKIKETRAYRNDRQDSLPDPIEVAKAIFDASTDNAETLRYLVGEDAKSMMAQRDELGAESYIRKIYEDYKK